MKLSKDLKTIYIIAIIVSLLSILFIGVNETNDTKSYIDAWVNISNGKLDIFRTPLYPIYLGIMKAIGGTNYFGILSVIGQYVIFMISIGVFYHICLRFINSSNITFYIILFYSIYPGVLHWCNNLQTETLAVSGMVFLLYCIMRLYNNFNILWTVITTLQLVLLLMLRPAFVYLLPVLAFSWIYLFFKREKKHQAIGGFISTIVATVVLLLYMTAFRQSYGVFATSNVSTINRLYIARQYGLLNPSVIKDSSLRSDIEKNIIIHGECCEEEYIWKEVDYYIENYDTKILQDALNSSALSHPITNISKVIGRVYQASYLSTLSSYGDGYIGTITDIIGLRTNIVYIFLLLYGIFVIKWCIKNHQIPWFSFVYYMLGISNLIVVLIGAQAEWMRLLLPSIPIYLLLFAQLCTFINLKSMKQVQIK